MAGWDKNINDDGEQTLLNVLQNNEKGANHIVERDSVQKEIQHSLKVSSKRDCELLVLFLDWALSLPYLWKRFDAGLIFRRNMSES